MTRQTCGVPCVLEELGRSIRESSDQRGILGAVQHAEEDARLAVDCDGMGRAFELHLNRGDVEGRHAADHEEILVEHRNFVFMITMVNLQRRMRGGQLPPPLPVLTHSPSSSWTRCSVSSSY